MKYYSEKDAEGVLKNFGFNVVLGVYCKKERELSSALISVGLPCVIKVAGKKIVHKGELGGVFLNVETYSDAINIFRKCTKIRGFDGVIVQKKINFNKEFILGVKKTEDFGHVILFGAGGTNVEKERDISFRVCPVNEEDALSLIQDVKITEGMGKKELLKISYFVKKLSDFVFVYPKLLELDINPFVFGGDGPIVLDARMSFE